ncbi:hypothetical protein P8936_09175 [Edaphobacter paludis]|uniref:eRF1 domain-containing protein n=1 Tax=Edaphobacter paludis TaxID=3035702 RepID=A0AAU7D1Q7_9BACT
MKTAPVPPVLPFLDLLSSETLAKLANVYDKQSHAVTLYFNRSTFSDKAHSEEALTFEHLVKSARDKSQSGDANPGLSKDLTRIFGMEPEFRSSPNRFKAIFACSDRQIWQEINLPPCGDFSRLEISQRFQIVPLLRAMEACTPYCVAIIEHGKARIFIVHGTEIHQMHQLPSEELTMDAEVSRVGWCHHTDGSLGERTKAYFKSLARDLRELLQDLTCQYLVVGCRDDLWSELKPQLVKAGMEDMISGRFNLSSFDMTPDEIVQAARPAITGKQRQQYNQFWESVREESDLSAISVNPVLRRLESGRVQTLFLGDLSGRIVTECANCHKWLNAGNLCPACGSSYINSLPAEELLVRKALSTGANTIAPDFAMAALFGEVGAILRY